MLCTEVKRGGSGTIEQIGGDVCLQQRLEAMGLRPGLKLDVVRCAPFGGPIEVAVRNVHLALRREDAAHIHLR